MPINARQDADVIIVGGGYAGMTAALQLARARRKVLVVDAAVRRNRFAGAAHGFLGYDGAAPDQLWATACDQLLAYPAAAYVEGEATQAEQSAEGIEVALSSGARLRAKKLIVASGVEDMLPDLPGLKERWGSTVLHCPYCHGYETGGGPLGVLAFAPHALHQAELIPDWGATTFFANEKLALTDEDKARLARRGVTVVTGAVAALVGDGAKLDGVKMKDGRLIEVKALFTATPTRVASPIPEQLGCAMEEGPLGAYVSVDAMRQTSRPGVFAAGDMTRPAGNIAFAVADGAMAGVAAHRSLIMDEMK